VFAAGLVIVVRKPAQQRKSPCDGNSEALGDAARGLLPLLRHRPIGKPHFRPEFLSPRAREEQITPRCGSGRSAVYTQPECRLPVAADSLLETMDTSLHAARMPAPGSLQTRCWRKADSNSVPSDRAVSKQGWLLVTLGGSSLERARKPPRASEERRGLGSGGYATGSR
jgi:hypothetical protein